MAVDCERSFVEGVIISNHRIIIVFGGTLTQYRLSHLLKKIRILSKIFNNIILIYGSKEEFVFNEKNLVAVNSLSSKKVTLPFNLPFFLTADLYNSQSLTEYCTAGDVVVFLGIYQPLTLFFSKLKRTSSILFCGGFDIVYDPNRNKFLDYMYVQMRWSIQIFFLTFFDKLIFESPKVLTNYNLVHFKDKSFCNAHLFVDLSTFYSFIPFAKRKYAVGYVGAFSEEKGIMQLTKSLPMVLNVQPSLSVHLVGDGRLHSAVRNYFIEHKIHTQVIMPGRLEYSKMPEILNNIKILVIPSYSEGLPNILLEAMACGTIVIANPVGGIGDVITDGVTGLLLSSNRPDSIAEKILFLLNNPKLCEEIARNASTEVLKYGFEESVKEWVHCFDNFKFA